MTRFKKGELSEEAFKVVMHDLGCMSIGSDDDQYHYDLLKGNLEDLFGMEEQKE